ncbi:MAG: cyanophycinase [Proteobacteria bacterium]|nr:cyanophycinase [Pseudomonadota bacterium]
MKSFQAFVFTAFFLLGSQALASTKLLLIGGGDYPQETLKLMSQWAGGKNSKIMILSWATDDTEYALEHLQESFSELGDEAPKEIVAPPYPGHDDYSKEDFLKALKEVGGVMISGGDQIVLMERLMSEPEFLPALHEAYQRGVVFAGNSAGTAAATQTMLTGNGEFDVVGPDKTEVATGIGFLKDIIVDQHFIARRRQNRLMSVLLTSKERLAFGIDEDCTLAIEDGRKGRVIGPGMAMTFDNREDRNKFVTHLLYPGDTFDMINGIYGSIPKPRH